VACQRRIEFQKREEGLSRMNAVSPVQRQLDAYNDRNLELFVAQYAEDVKVFRPPVPEPVISGKSALAEHYKNHRFNLPNLHAELLGRLVLGNKVIDHERIAGVGNEILEAAAVYEVVGEHIQTVWFFNAK
jgi:hypothetical protein